MSTYGSHPEQMTVKLTVGDGAHLVATSANGWAGPVSLVWGPDDGQWTEETATLTDVGTVDGTEVSWTLTIAEVTARAAFPYVRLVDNGMTMQAGEVIPWTGGLGSTVTQTIASLTAGPPGPTAVSADADNVATLGTDGLIYVSPADAGGFSDAAVAAFVSDEDSDTYAAIAALQPDLSGYVETTDPRLSDARTPTAHEHTAADVDSGASSDGQVLTSDGAGGAAWETPASGVTDHGLLSGLDDDDHTQYALADGSRGSFAATSHTHVIADTTGLQTALDGKAASSHTHTLSQVTDAGDSAGLDVGTTAGTVAAGDDSRITGAAQKSANLSDMADASTARTNLGLGTAATTDADDYATAAQGGKADTAVQPTLVDAKGDLLVGTAADTLARLPASTNGHVLTLDSAQDAGMKWAAPAAGGGGFIYPLSDPALDPLDATYGDDFDEASLNARWTRIGITSGEEAYQQGASGSTLQANVSGGAAFRGYSQPVPAGDFDASVFVAIYAQAASIVGLCALASDDSGRGMFAYTNPSLFVGTVTAGGAYGSLVAGSNLGAGASGNPHAQLGAPTWFRIRRVGSECYFYSSTNGETWYQHAQVTLPGVTKIAFCRVYGATSPHVFHLHRFNMKAI